MKGKTANILLLVFSIILPLGVMTLFKACGPMEDGSWMHCHTAQMDVFYIGIALAVLALIALIVKAKAVQVVLPIISAVLAIVAMLIPGNLVSMCMMDTMRCYAVMKPFVLVMGVLVIVVAAACVVSALKQDKQAGRR